jgi:hypothetical protein
MNTMRNPKTDIHLGKEFTVFHRKDNGKRGAHHYRTPLYFFEVDGNEKGPFGSRARAINEAKHFISRLVPNETIDAEACPEPVRLRSGSEPVEGPVEGAGK